MPTNPFAIVQTALSAARPENRAMTWREDLRRRLPQDRLHDILAGLAEGKPFMAELPDGRCCEPILPTADVRLRAATYLHEALYGKAVAQTEINRAELEAKEFEAVRALSDDELEREAAKILEARKVIRLTPGKVTEAEFVELPSDPIVRVWQAEVSDQQE